ncbi:Fructose-bisphosphate aldolase class 2 [Buchnera aphidicola (Eriosoma grossulariae)]|uniref:class II fructose-bisphosphate aldolase n=1 Tax=Buchnera aphidicola TaxID=9 RepID=UPI003463F643
MCHSIDYFKPGVLSAHKAQELFKIAKKNNFALPAVNCIGNDSINTALETASLMQSAIIIQFSYGGSIFISGLGIKNKNQTELATLGSISGAQHVHLLAKHYKVPVILHTDHCHKDILPWIDQLLEEGKKFFKNNGKPLFTSHMIDLSKENIKDNIQTCTQYFEKMNKINMMLEIELGCTGGEEDGIDNSSINIESLYTKPEEVNYAYQKLKCISPNFTIAASFGNVHGVYKTGNVQLIPSILKKSQKFVKEKNYLSCSKPLNFVFHGGSGSSINEIKKSINYGIIKMNLDTDMQWATWNGVLKFYKKNKNYLQGQLGNPEGIHVPNKKYYDPRNWIRESQKSMSIRLQNAFKILNSNHIFKRK